jgi:thiol:disulfide interchange protein DsbA
MMIPETLPVVDPAIAVFGERRDSRNLSASRIRRLPQPRGEPFMFLKIVFGGLLGVFFSAQAWSFDEGIDYTALSKAQPTETADKIEVVEVFMYSCPHCYHLEPAIEAWLKTKPENVEFLKMPAVFGPKVEPHARAFYAAQLVGVEETFTKALFKALHVDKRAVWKEDELVSLAGEQGIDEAEFRKAYNSFFVNMKVRRAAEMGQRYGVDGVPAVVVNGKYRTSPSQTGSQQGMIQVVNHLIDLESGKVASGQGTPAPAGGS